MARFTKALRQQIISDFAEKNGGWFDPTLFLAEVREIGDAHPAFEWFEWDDDKAAEEYRIEQARDFMRGLTIKFEVQSIYRGTMRVVEHSAPFAVSPLDKRRQGGGYYLTDANDPAQMAELCRQAAQSLRWFMTRYEGALAYSGVSMAALEKMQTALEDATSERQAA